MGVVIVGDELMNWGAMGAVGEQLNNNMERKLVYPGDLRRLT